MKLMLSSEVLTDAAGEALRTVSGYLAAHPPTDATHMTFDPICNPVMELVRTCFLYFLHLVFETV